MSQSPFPKGGEPPWWWNGYRLSHDWQRDLNERLRWLYGDAQERTQANLPDVEAWRNIGRAK